MNEEVIVRNQEENPDSIEMDQVGKELITVPFNPMSIRIRRDPFTLGQLVDKMEHGEIRFDTPYQRKDNLWDLDKQSRLIESILLRLPLPVFYFDEADEVDQIWNVIDGLQRCSVFRNYIVDRNTKLSGLEFLTEYNDCCYNALPRELQRRIMQTPLTIYVVEKGTPDEVKYNIFKRINTGGLILNPQEIRHAMNQGKADEYIAMLAQKGSFKKSTCYIIPTYRMEDQDFVTRFVAFYLLGEDSYLPDLDSFLTKGMAAICRQTENELEMMTDGFERAMQLAWRIFGNDAFRKRYHEEDRRRPLNKTLFEVMSVCFARLTDEQCEELAYNADEFRRRFRNLNWNEKFIYAITSGTGNKDSVRIRYAEINRIITETLSYHVE